MIIENESLIEEYIQKIIDEDSGKGKRLRNWSYFTFVLSILAVAILFYISQKTISKPPEIVSSILFIVFCLLIISFSIFFVRSLLSLGNAYSLRCGQLEDIKIILMLNKLQNISIEDGLKIVLSLQRDVMKDMVKLSLPDNFAQKPLDKLSDKINGNAKK